MPVAATGSTLPAVPCPSGTRHRVIGGRRCRQRREREQRRLGCRLLPTAIPMTVAQLGPAAGEASLVQLKEADRERLIAIGAVRSCGATTVGLGLAATPGLHIGAYSSSRPTRPVGPSPRPLACQQSRAWSVWPQQRARRTGAVELAITHTHALPGGRRCLRLLPPQSKSRTPRLRC